VCSSRPNCPLDTLAAKVKPSAVLSMLYFCYVCECVCEFCVDKITLCLILSLDSLSYSYWVAREYWEGHTRGIAD